MTSFVVLNLASDMRTNGFVPTNTSLADTARACHRLGAERLNDMIGVDLMAEMAEVPESDRRWLQVGSS